MYLAGQLSLEFQQFVEKISTEFNPLLPKSDTHIEYPFVVNKDGQFLKPWYLENLGSGTETFSNPDCQKYFEIAQRAEFRAKEYHLALENYRRAFSSASSRTDSARSLNAIGRVYMKSLDFTNSHSTYSRILSNYAPVLDNNGYPFANYALINLLIIQESNHTQNIRKDVRSFLEDMNSGIIPLNRSTSDILDRISLWNQDVGREESNYMTEMKKNILSIQRKLAFIQIYTAPIKASLESWRADEFQFLLGKYMVIPENTFDPGRAVLIDPGPEQAAGFSIHLDSLWPQFMKTDFSGSTVFKYEILLIKKGMNGIRSDPGLTFTTEISPVFPQHEIRIGLEDENLVHSFVQKRRWSYGIALFLLLGAMLLGILLILRDIARERRLSHLRSDFVSNVSHELKTPLTSIHVFAESVLLDRVKSPADQKEYLKIILKETERLKRMINNILDFSRREKGKVEYQARPVDVSALLKAAISDLSYWLEEMGFKVQTEIEEGVLTSGDPEALKQVVINLLDNSIKYSDKVKEICVRLRKKEKILRIEVADRGMGIPKEQAGHIFDKFYRVNNSQVKGIAGTGLGLTVVKDIVEAHGGEVLVKSDPGKGSVFTVILNSM